jgi:polysaccharide export outer membrane protein
MSVMLLFGAVLNACETDRGIEWDGEPRSSNQRRPYLLGAGDKIRVTIYQDENLSGTYGVDNLGRISLPLVGGVQANGLTIPELEQNIAMQLSRGFISNPSVSIELISARPFCILGQVNKPGCFEYRFGMNGADAIATAGGYTYRAKENKLFIRGEDGQKLTGSHDTPIFPGDTIEIVERYF